VRFEGIVRPAVGSSASFAEFARLGVDRIPDPSGEVRILASVDDLVELVDRGFEVSLQRAVRLRPLGRELIADDKAVRAWFEDQVQGIKRKRGS
jgi:hypothetical protein